jgi:hypothetical protein
VIGLEHQSLGPRPRLPRQPRPVEAPDFLPGCVVGGRLVNSLVHRSPRRPSRTSRLWTSAAWSRRGARENRGSWQGSEHPGDPIDLRAIRRCKVAFCVEGVQDRCGSLEGRSRVAAGMQGRPGEAIRELDHAASWKMTPSVWRCPERIRLTPCRRFTR